MADFSVRHYRSRLPMAEPSPEEEALYALPHRAGLETIGGETMTPAAVLFDLDDTLIDFQYSRRCGLRLLQELLPALGGEPLERLELVHDEQLHANYLRTLDGSLSDDEARIERVRGICRHYGVDADIDTVREATQAYAREQQSNRRVVPGVPELLAVLAERCRLGVVTNGPSDRQREKLALCGIETGQLAALAISAEVGVNKPDPAIFRHALSQLGGVEADRVVFVGDSWPNDVLGARATGMRPVWINRYSQTSPDPAMAAEIDGFEPLDKSLEVLGFGCP